MQSSLQYFILILRTKSAHQKIKNIPASRCLFVSQIWALIGDIVFLFLAASANEKDSSLEVSFFVYLVIIEVRILSKLATLNGNETKFHSFIVS